MCNALDISTEICLQPYLQLNESTERNISCMNAGNPLICHFWVTPCWHQPWRPHALHVCVGFLIIPPRQDMSVSIIGESKLSLGASVSAVIDWQSVLRTRSRKPNVTFISHDQRWKEDRVIRRYIDLFLLWSCCNFLKLIHHLSKLPIGSPI